MSRAYRIRVSEKITRVVHVEDGVSAPLELLPILAKDRMGELLAAELEKRGFRREGQTVVRREEDGTEVTIDLPSATVTIKLAQEDAISRQAEREEAVARVEGAKEKLSEKVKQELERQIEVERERLRERVTKRLEQKVRDLREELDQAVNQVTAAALKERASQIGQIEEIHEEENGSMTIKVRL